ncbi:MAG TPA: carboxypeptidase-like regulatory domain-containing protein [Acidobacteriota bacterium]|jgi:hypothetical protein
MGQIKGDAGSVSGSVADPSGRPLVDATVALLSAQRHPLRVARTDARGAFRFESVAAGSYVVSVSRKDFSTRNVPIAVQDAVVTPVSVIVPNRAGTSLPFSITERGCGA